MKTTDLIIRLNYVSSQVATQVFTSLWDFSILNGARDEKVKLTQRVAAALNRHSGEAVTDEDHLTWRLEGPSAWGAAERFSKEPYPYFKFVVALEEILDQVVLASQSSAKVQLLHSLDFIAAHELRVPSSNGNFYLWPSPYTATDLSILESRLEDTRRIWRTYLGHFLFESAVRSGLTEPAFFEELLLEYPTLDLALVLNIFDHHHWFTRTRYQEVELYRQFNLYSAGAIGAALTHLGQAGILGEVNYSAPADGSSGGHLTFTLGPRARELCLHPLPIF
jgi:hypothetical protein